MIAKPSRASRIAGANSRAQASRPWRACASSISRILPGTPTLSPPGIASSTRARLAVGAEEISRRRRVRRGLAAVDRSRGRPRRVVVDEEAAAADARALRLDHGQREHRRERGVGRAAALRAGSRRPPRPRADRRRRPAPPACAAVGAARAVAQAASRKGEARGSRRLSIRRRFSVPTASVKRAKPSRAQQALQLARRFAGEARALDRPARCRAGRGSRRRGSGRRRRRRSRCRRPRSAAARRRSRCGNRAAAASASAFSGAPERPPASPRCRERSAGRLSVVLATISASILRSIADRGDGVDLAPARDRARP